METAIAAIVGKERHRRSGNSVLRVCFLLFLVEFLVCFFFSWGGFSLLFSLLFFFFKVVFFHTIAVLLQCTGAYVYVCFLQSCLVLMLAEERG